MDLDPYNWEIILTWNENKKYKDPVYTFKVRDRNKMPTYGITFILKSRK
jgi:methylmalonyl-CoA mutase